MKYSNKLIFFFILLILVSCSDKIIRNQTDKNHCLIFGQVDYNFPGMVEEGLRGVILINLQTGNEYETKVLPYEKGFIAVDVPIGQYAIKTARWIFLDTKTLAESGLYRQISIELKFTSESYNKTNFEIKKGGVFFAGAYEIEHFDTKFIKQKIGKRFFYMLDKILENLELTSWKDMFKVKIGELINEHRVLAYEFLKSKYPSKKQKTLNELKKKYLAE